jgi:hypothetical protein
MTRTGIPLQFALYFGVALLPVPLAAGARKRVPAHPVDRKAAPLSPREQLPGVGAGDRAKDSGIPPERRPVSRRERLAGGSANPKNQLA